MAWSPDGKLIASTGGDAAVHLWDPTTGSLALMYAGQAAPVYAVAWSPDGSLLASVGMGQSLRVWRSASGEDLFVLPDLPANAGSVTWSPDGTLIATGGSSGSVCVWSAQDGHLVWSRPLTAGLEVLSVAWSWDGTILACSGENLYEIWHLPSQTLLATPSVHQETVAALVWVGSQYAISASYDSTVAIVTTSGEEQARYEGHTSWATALAVSPDGKWVASTEHFVQDGIHIWPFPFLRCEESMEETSTGTARPGPLVSNIG